MKKSQECEPRTPPHHFIELLYIQHSEDEDKLVKNEVPETVLYLLGKHNEIYEDKLRDTRIDTCTHTMVVKSFGNTQLQL